MLVQIMKCRLGRGYTSLQDRWKLWHQRFTSWRKRTAGCATKISVWEWDQSTHDKISFHEVIVTRRECPAAVSDLPFTVLLDGRCIWRKIARFSSWYFDVECCGWNTRVAMSHSYSAQRIRKTKSKITFKSRTVSDTLLDLLYVSFQEFHRSVSNHASKAAE